MSDLADREQQLRIDQMTINIEKMRADMRWESRKFAVSLLVGAAAVAAASATVATYFARLPQPAPPPQTIIIQQQPYAPPPGQPAR